MSAEGWLDPASFYFNKIIEENVELIRNEFFSIAKKKLLVAYSHKGKEGIVNTGWSGFLLRKKEQWIEENCVHAPITVSLLKSFPEISNQNKGVFGFSVVYKNSTIYDHTNEMGPNARYRHQLCIDPKDQLDKECSFLTVNNTNGYWEYGKVLSFDDGYIHSVTNNSSSSRAVLIYDSITH